MAICDIIARVTLAVLMLLDLKDHAFGDDSCESKVIFFLALELAEQLAGQYHIDPEDAFAIIAEIWTNELPLRRSASAEQDPQRLKRTSTYKKAAKKAKTATYYSLRRYKKDEQALLEGIDTLRNLAAAGTDPNDPRAFVARDAIIASHVSASERMPDLEIFFCTLFDLRPHPTSILDLGCGVLPLLYPFDNGGRNTKHYLGLDRDKSVVDAVNAWAAQSGDGKLEARCWSLSDGFGDILGPESDGGFALALGLKLIPVIARQERDLLPIFCDVPAPYFIVTGARQSMVKHRSINRREKGVLRTFIDQQGFTILRQFETTTEVGMLLETVWRKE